MSESAHNPKPGFLEKLARGFMNNRPERRTAADEPYILNQEERTTIKKVYWKTLAIAAMLGALGVLLLYIPQYLFPQLFPDTPIRLFGKRYDLPLVTTAYSLFLVFAEIYVLTYFNLRAVRDISAICQFPFKQDPEFKKHQAALVEAALEKENLGILAFGINPYFGLPRGTYYVYFIFNKLKAALSNVILKLLIRRILGRFAVRAVTDLAGIPIYAFWNAWASHLVIREAKIRIMAPLIIRQFAASLKAEYGENELFKDNIVEALQYVAVLKRRFNYTHYLLTEEMFTVFQCRKEAPESDYAQKLVETEPGVRKGLLRLIVFGVLIDGNLSAGERKRLRTLHEKGILPIPIAQIEQMGKDYLEGRGLEG